VRILFATTRLYPPDRHGGAQNSAHALLSRVVVRGHQCEVAAAHPAGARLLARRALFALSGRRWLGRADLVNGYPTFRAAPWHLAALVAQRCERQQPDVLVTDHVDVIQALARQPTAPRIPTLLRVADVGFRNTSADWVRHGNVRVFANSAFIATRLREELGIDAPVLYPIVDPALYRTPRDGAAMITLINPIQGKGLDVVLGIADRLPARRFMLVSGWPRPNPELERLRVAVRDRPNVTLEAWTADMRTVYTRTRLLLFPAQWEEGFGRVVLEAHSSGIPVVASDRGGLPEAVRDGGCIVPFDAAIDTWAATVDRIMGDDTAYAELSARARANLERPEFDADSITDRFVELLHAQVGRGEGARVEG
jgi:glycosyltransferase involved in cell wall biosynthesis